MGHSHTAFDYHRPDLTRPNRTHGPKMKTQDMNRDWISTASTLNKALPYLQRYAGATVVIKLGGHSMGSDEAMDEFARDVVLMRQVGVNPVIVHGGGPMINEMLDKLDIQSEFVNGVDPRLLRDLAEKEYIPVIAPLGADRSGQTFNINGDTAAGAVAAALKADRLLLLTDVPGVKNDAGDVLTELSAQQIREMTMDGTIAGGMIPKTETALAAIQQGVRAVVILDGRAPNACLLELFTEHGAGSIIRAE